MLLVVAAHAVHAADRKTLGTAHDGHADDGGRGEEIAHGGTLGEGWDESVK
jgi:hypothetical protein